MRFYYFDFSLLDPTRLLRNLGKSFFAVGGQVAGGGCVGDREEGNRELGRDGQGQGVGRGWWRWQSLGRGRGGGTGQTGGRAEKPA